MERLEFKKEFKIGENANVRVPDVDCGPSDPRNLLVVILSASEGIYLFFRIKLQLTTYFVKFDRINKV